MSRPICFNLQEFQGVLYPNLTVEFRNLKPSHCLKRKCSVKYFTNLRHFFWVKNLQFVLYVLCLSYFMMW